MNWALFGVAVAWIAAVVFGACTAIAWLVVLPFGYIAATREPWRYNFEVPARVFVWPILLAVSVAYLVVYYYG